MSIFKSTRIGERGIFISFVKMVTCFVSGVGEQGKRYLSRRSHKLQWLFSREDGIGYCVLIVPFGTNILINPYH